MTPRHMAHWLLQRNEKMKTAVSSWLSKGLRHYKRESDNNLHLEPTFQGGGEVFWDRRQLAAMSSDAAEKMGNRQYNKLLCRATGQYRVLHVQHHTVNIEADSILSTVSIDFLTPSHTWEEMTECLHETTYTMWQQNEDKQLRNVL